jgi:hypothetical protein
MKLLSRPTSYQPWRALRSWRETWEGNCTRAKSAKDAKVQTAWEIAHAVVKFAFELHHEQLQWLEEFSILFGEDEATTRPPKPSKASTEPHGFVTFDFKRSKSKRRLSSGLMATSQSRT